MDVGGLFLLWSVEVVVVWMDRWSLCADLVVPNTCM